MDQQPSSDSQPVYHGPDGAVTGTEPRLFALMDYGEDDTGAWQEVALYGIALPSGTAATIRPDGHPHGQWSSAGRLARRLDLELVWLDTAT